MAFLLHIVIKITALIITIYRMLTSVNSKKEYNTRQRCQRIGSHMHTNTQSITFLTMSFPPSLFLGTSIICSYTFEKATD